MFSDGVSAAQCPRAVGRLKQILDLVVEDLMVRLSNFLQLVDQYDCISAWNERRP